MALFNPWGNKSSCCEPVSSCCDKCNVDPCCCVKKVKCTEGAAVQQFSWNAGFNPSVNFHFEAVNDVFPVSPIAVVGTFYIGQGEFVQVDPANQEVAFLEVATLLTRPTGLCHFSLIINQILNNSDGVTVKSFDIQVGLAFAPAGKILDGSTPNNQVNFVNGSIVKWTFKPGQTIPPLIWSVDFAELVCLPPLIAIAPAIVISNLVFTAPAEPETAEIDFTLGPILAGAVGQAAFGCCLAPPPCKPCHQPCQPCDPCALKIQF